MPSAWSAKDERQYGHILKSCRHGAKRCKSIAGATVNKTRSREGRTLSGVEENRSLMIIFALAAGLTLLKLSSP